MDKKQLKKIIKYEFEEIFKKNNFISKSETLYLKVTKDNVLHIINFDLGQNGFTCSIAMQPLYIIDYSKTISLNMGGRISRFKIIKNEWWAYEKPEIGINEIKDLLIKNGLPWMEKYGTPKGIIEFIKNGKKNDYGIIYFDSFHQKKYLGFSLLYTGAINEGAKIINEIIYDINDNASELMLDYKIQLIELYDILKDDPKRVPQILNDAIVDYRKNISI